MRPTFFHHLHPPTIPARQARWRYTLGAGGLAVFLSVILIVTGALEMFYYIPTPEQAALSVQAITFLVPFGGLVRHLHYWAAQGLVLVALVHLARVAFTGAYARTRRFNYLLGMALFALVLVLDFSGYVLRWDQGVQWAIAVGTNLLQTIPGAGAWLYRVIVGGEAPGAPTVIRFYAGHVFALPLALVAIVAWHVFRVRRDGGIAVPPPAQRPDDERITRGELVRREALAALLALIALLALASLVPAPLSPPINPANPAVAARAPWFLLWVQRLVRLGDPFWLGVAVPVGALLALTLLPYVTPAPRPEEVGRPFPRGGRLLQVLVAVLLLAVAILTLIELLP
jgi:quinol-cytochrome oxidoreductase complex cytochrome b subunit